MRPTQQMIALLRSQLLVSPLGDSEMRRVEGMGELYLSLTKQNSPQYEYVYTLEIDGVGYYFHTGKGKVS